MINVGQSVDGLFKSLRFALINYAKETFRNKKYTKSATAKVIETLKMTENSFNELHVTMSDYKQTFGPSCELMLKSPFYSRPGWFLEKNNIILSFEAESLPLSEIYKLSLELALSGSLSENKSEAFGKISLAILSHLYSIYLLICSPEQVRLISGILKNIKIDLKLEIVNEGSNDFIQNLLSGLGVDCDIGSTDVAKGLSGMLNGDTLKGVVAGMSDVMGSVTLGSDMGANMKQIMEAMEKKGTLEKIMSLTGIGATEKSEKPPVIPKAITNFKVEETE